MLYIVFICKYYFMYKLIYNLLISFDKHHILIENYFSF